MGVPIAERVLAAGHSLWVYNRTPAKAAPLVEHGGKAVAHARDLLEHADVCITMVADDDALEAIALGPGGVLAGARRDAILIDMSTVSTSASRRVSDGAARAGVQFVRAPVSGNPTVVRAGNLTIIASGPRESFERVEPLLRAIGPNIYYVGEADEARVVKLALQVMIGGTAQLMSEALVLGEAGGVSRRTLLEVMSNSAVGSPFVKYKTGPLLEDDYSATFTTKMMKKDLGLVLSFAREARVSLPMTSELEDLLDDAIGAGYADLDFMALFLRLRGLAGGPATPRAS